MEQLLNMIQKMFSCNTFLIESKSEIEDYIEYTIEDEMNYMGDDY